ncbi:MAG: AAA-like domain-containing protein [Hormoscilla sp. GUM202]|nr:AAA-like domain-containing protein [Hormoscilla sp. GUM202]
MSKYTRRRGVTLTDQGSRKLNQAKAEAEIEQKIKRHTLESLSDATGLTPNTLSKIFTGSTGVDKRTLKCCFDFFNLTLLTEDYLYLKPERDKLAEISSMLPAETGSPIELASNSPFERLRNRHNPPLTNKMAPSLEDLPPRIPTAPGGHLPLGSVFYVDRPICESLYYEAIGQPGAMVNIRAPKQMGKTSLMKRILVYASHQCFHTVSLSLQLADADILQNLKLFLQWFCARVSKQLECDDAQSIARWAIAEFWDNSLGSKSNATDYLEDVLSNCDRPLVMAIDEINQLFAYPDIAREFLEMLRVWSEKAKENGADSNPWHKLRLVTVHSTEILIPPSLNPSLLNTALVIQLPEFTSSQVQDLAQRWEQEITAQQIEQLITLLGGHPYRLQLAFYYLRQQTITTEELLENSAIATAMYAEHLEQQWWNLKRYPELVTVFTQIVRQSSPVDYEAAPVSQLHKMGLVHLQGLRASLACELFRPFFRDRLLERRAIRSTNKA